MDNLKIGQKGLVHVPFVKVSRYSCLSNEKKNYPDFCLFFTSVSRKKGYGKVSGFRSDARNRKIYWWTDGEQIKNKEEKEKKERAVMKKLTSFVNGMCFRI